MAEGGGGQSSRNSGPGSKIKTHRYEYTRSRNRQDLIDKNTTEIKVTNCRSASNGLKQSRSQSVDNLFTSDKDSFEQSITKEIKDRFHGNNPASASHVPNVQNTSYRQPRVFVKTPGRRFSSLDRKHQNTANGSKNNKPSRPSDNSGCDSGSGKSGIKNEYHGQTNKNRDAYGNIGKTGSAKMPIPAMRPKLVPRYGPDMKVSFRKTRSAALNMPVVTQYGETHAATESAEMTEDGVILDRHNLGQDYPKPRPQSVSSKRNQAKPKLSQRDRSDGKVAHPSVGTAVKFTDRSIPMLSGDDHTQFDKDRSSRKSSKRRHSGKENDTKYLTGPLDRPSKKDAKKKTSAVVEIQKEMKPKEFSLAGKYVQAVIFGNNYKTCVKSVDKGKDIGCSVIVEFQSVKQCRKAVSIVGKKNLPGINVRVLSNEDSPKTDESENINEIKDIEKKAKKVLAGHDKKIVDVNKNMGKYNRPGLQDRPGLQEKEAAELETLQSKLLELQEQKRTFQDCFKDISEKIRNVKSENRTDRKRQISELRQRFGQECHRLLIALPIYSKRDDFIALMATYQVCIVLAETGSGKSTQMVQYLQQAGFANGKLIGCTQPRKIAAVSLAKHVSSEMNCRVGELVGYKVGMRSRMGKQTEIVYMTDHCLLNECLKDRALESYSCVVIDEAHERSLYSDLLLGMLKKCLASRPDLKIVITSATINPDIFVRYFDGCPILRVSGRLFPVDVVWKSPQDCSTEDYVTEAVKKAMEIHRKGESVAGDILVFMTSGMETEKAVTMMQNMKGSGNTTILQLHGKLQPEEQQLVFQPTEQGKRKVVFATNCAETSITIPGITVIIDTGMVKEMKYDPKRNMKSLELTMINKSSAEQRKGRAGRTECGTCYRLYTEDEYTNMPDSSLPEILRVHLGQALLTLINLGVEDPLTFDFVESPTTDALLKAMESLVDLQAVVDGKLTDLGSMLAKFPVDPCLGKVILKGVEIGAGMEALVIAALSTVASNIFFRAGSQEEKSNADKRKVRFCHPRGDILTYLEVFKEWNSIAEQQKNAWCVKNSINAKSMRITRDTVKELLDVLRKDLDIQLKYAFPNEDIPDIQLSRIIFDCYFTNLCVYTGNQNVGYAVARLDRNVQLHPSGALNFTGNYPQWIVFEQLTTTSRDFIMCITTVEEEWILEMQTDGRMKFDVAALKNRILSQKVVTNIGSSVMQSVIGPRFTRLHQLEEVIANQCSGSLVKLEPNRDRGEICIYTIEQHISLVENILLSVIQGEREKLATETKESYLSAHSSVCVVWGSGADIQHVMMPGEYRTVLVQCVPHDMDHSDVLEFMEKFGDITESIVFGLNKKLWRSKNWGKITYKDPKMADRAVRETATGTPMAVPERKTQTNEFRSDFTVQAEWCRRPKRDIAFVKLCNPEDSVMVLSGSSHLRINEFSVPMRRSKDDDDTLFLAKLHTSISEADIKKAVLDTCPLVAVNRVFRPRTKVEETPPEVVDAIRGRLIAEIKAYISQDRFDVHVLKPRIADFFWKATIKFKFVEDRETVLASLKNFSIGDQLVTFKADMRSSIYIPPSVEKHVCKDLDEAMAHIKDSGSVTIMRKMLRNKTTVVDIDGDDQTSIKFATEIIQNVIKADIIDCSKSDALMSLLRRTSTRGIADRTGALLQHDQRTNTLFIYGTDASKSKAKIEINTFLEHQETLATKEIVMKGPDKPIGLMKALVLKYGFDLDDLRQECDLVNLNLNLKRHSMCASGSEESITKFTETVESISQSLDPVAKSEDSIDCVVCFCPINTAVVHLELCGHAYCVECVENQINVSIRSKDIPIVCAAENCNEPFSVKDLNTILKNTNHLVDAAVSSYVTRNSTSYKYCITPNCPVIFQITDKGSIFQCEECSVKICTTCKVQYHQGMSCAMYQGKEVDPDFDLKVWMNRKGKKVCKTCPQCNTVIEKNGGCMRMRCGHCKTIFCWICKERFASDDGCYDHLAKDHDGIFAYENED